ncbi:nuclear transport factor 2 family protein [Spirosoma arcticum]
MYNAIIRHNIKKAFQLVNDHQYDEVAKNLSPAIRHHFSGDHALGGTRHDRTAVMSWFERVGRLLPDLKLTITRVIVKGWPNNTLVIAQWTAAASLPDGGEYRNQGVHFVTLKWGKITDMTVYEDSQAVTDALEKQYRAGLQEAKADPIVS